MNAHCPPMQLAAAACTLIALVAGQAAGAQGQGSAAAPPETTPAGDLRQLCPGVDTGLEDALGPVWQRVGEPATVRIQLRVSGRDVAVERVSGWPLEYRQAVMRAAGRLACDAGPGSSRTLGFEVRFVGPDAAVAPAQLARR